MRGIEPPSNEFPSCGFNSLSKPSIPLTAVEHLQPQVHSDERYVVPAGVEPAAANLGGSRLHSISRTMDGDAGNDPATRGLQSRIFPSDPSPWSTPAESRTQIPSFGGTSATPLPGVKFEVRETPTGTVWELARLADATYLLCFPNHGTGVRTRTAIARRQGLYRPRWSPYRAGMSFPYSIAAE